MRSTWQFRSRRVERTSCLAGRRIEPTQKTRGRFFFAIFYLSALTDARDRCQARFPLLVRHESKRKRLRRIAARTDSTENPAGFINRQNRQSKSSWSRQPTPWFPNAWCSMAEVIKCRPCSRLARAYRMARLWVRCAEGTDSGGFTTSNRATVFAAFFHGRLFGAFGIW